MALCNDAGAWSLTLVVVIERAPAPSAEIGAWAFLCFGAGTYNGVVRVNGAGAWSSSSPAKTSSEWLLLNVSKCPPSFGRRNRLGIKHRNVIRKVLLGP
jgi:hypothetical protein